MAIMANDRVEAFKLVTDLTSSYLEKYNYASDNCKSTIFICSSDSHIDFIEEFNDHLEIVCKDGPPITIWIKEEKPESNIPKNIKEKLTNKIYELINKEEYDNIYKLLEIMSDYKDIIE